MKRHKAKKPKSVWHRASRNLLTPENAFTFSMLALIILAAKTFLF